MLREVTAAGNYAGGSADRSAGGLRETQIAAGGGEEPPVGIADRAAAFGHEHLTLSRGLDRKSAAQSGATSMAWPVWALFVTASVNSM